MWKGKKAWIWTARVREVKRGKSRAERRKCYGGEGERDGRSVTKCVG